MRINVAVPEAHVAPPVLNAALEATTRLNESLIKAGDVPLFDEVRNRIRWKPEPPGDEHFDHAKVVLGRGWGDCDDMAPFAAASMRATGEDPGARAIVKRSGPKRWHAVVQRSDGSIRDPSRETGMGQNRGIVGAGLPFMFQPGAAVVGGAYVARPQLALRPIFGPFSRQVEAWQARADLPWHFRPGKSPVDVAMASLHASPVSSEAIVGACDGLITLAEANGQGQFAIDRAAAIRDACDGYDWYDLAQEYGPDHATAAGQVVGSFFRSLGRMVKRINPVKVLSKAVSFVPGVGPVASMALDAASPALQKLVQSGHHLPPPKAAPPGMPTYGTPPAAAPLAAHPFAASSAPGGTLAELRIFR